MITTRAPLRIPLGGGGTDLSSYYERHGGFVLSAGIDKYVYIQLNTLKVEDFIRVKYSRTEKVEEPGQIEHPLLREALKYTGIQGGLEISAMADVPGRTGMGSSGSFTVALLAALRAHQRRELSRRELAEEAHRVETQLAGQPAGKHDHYLAAYGGLSCLEIAPDGRVEVSALQLSNHTLEELRNSMVLFFTGIQRESFDILSQQQQDTQRGDAQVVESLHEVKRIGYQVKAALEEGQLDRFGLLLNEHWQMKKRRSAMMSNPRIDAWYEQGRRAGALGGKILGAGGGGFLMFYCPSQHRLALRQHMADEGLREMNFQFDLEGAKVLMNI
ncbi:MAG: galactokinase [Candidatus Handelsmanbacteria bacterium]|nr:galactokinase [Candidatus Handelsmanbacteria bacterium]